MSEPDRAPSVVPGDFSGGLASAVVAVPGNIMAGVIAFAPLGAEYAGVGVLSGMLASIVAGLAASLTGSAPGMITGPKATTATLFAAMMTALISAGELDTANPEHVELLLSLSFMAVFLSGSVQVLLGAFRVGALAKFMPYPVVAGIRNTTAIVLVSRQMWPLLGVDLALPGGLMELFRPFSLLVGVVTAAVAFRGGRVLPKPIVPVVALLVGSILHHVLDRIVGVPLGSLLGEMPAMVPTSTYIAGFVEAFTGAPDLLFIVVKSALAIAVLDAVTALITLVSYQSIADRRFDGNRQLVGQGVGSAAGALVGGLTTSGILARAAVNHSTGGRTRVSGVVNALGVLALGVAFGWLLELIPEAAIAGLIMVIAYGLFDRWTVGQLEESFRPEAENPRNNRVAVALMAVVVGVGVTRNLVDAVGVGVLLSVILFVAQMSRSPIRRVRTGRSVRSARRRDDHLTALLSEYGDRIAVVELEGALFFGSSDALATRLESLVDHGAQQVLVELRRVSEIDATGYKVLGQAYQRLTKRGVRLAFSHVQLGGVNNEIAEDLVQAGVPVSSMYETGDHALQLFEETMLAELDPDGSAPAAWDVARFGLAWGLDGHESEVLEGYLMWRTYAPGDFVVKEGDEGRSLFLLAEGLADVTIAVGPRRRRLAGFQQGTVFGEMSLLDGAPRGAAISAHTDLVILELEYDAYQRLVVERPEIALKVQVALGRILGGRLRGANALIWELDS